MMPNETLAVVGGGASGLILATRLLSAPNPPAHLVLLDPRPAQGQALGQGIAYGTAFDGHLLNVPAGRMSLWPEQPGDFVAWAAEMGLLLDGRPLGPTDYAPRQWYGRYLRDRFTQAVAAVAGRSRVDIQPQAVQRVTPAGDGWALEHPGGRIDVARVVLATGHHAPSWPVPFLADPAVTADPRLIGDPWDGAALAAVGAEDRVLLIGTGLTMVDVVLSLRAQGHRGPITALSRHGLLPLVHADPPAPPMTDFPDGVLFTGGPRALLRFLRRRIAEGGADWRQVIDGLRPHTQAIWAAWTDAQKRQFLRHPRAYWEVHRHRVAPRIGAGLAAELAGDGVTVLAGRVLGVRPDPAGVTVTFRERRGGTGRIIADHVVDCTGPTSDLTRVDDPLFRGLLDDGVAQADALGLGLLVDADSRVIARSGQVWDHLFALGPLTKPRFWEITAIPDIRVQAAQVARLLARLLAG